MFLIRGNNWESYSITGIGSELNPSRVQLLEVAVRAEDIQIEADYLAEISQNQQRPRRPASRPQSRGWIAIAQFHKRGGSSLRTKDVIILPLFSTASLLSTSACFHPRLLPSPSVASPDVSPTLARNPLFARQTRIVCSQESAVVEAEGRTTDSREEEKERDRGSEGGRTEF